MIPVIGATITVADRDVDECAARDPPQERRDLSHEGSPPLVGQDDETGMLRLLTVYSPEALTAASPVVRGTDP